MTGHIRKVYGTQEQLSPDKNISNVIRDGVKQLAAYQEKSVDFRLLWLQARTLHPDVQMQQFEATLYGLVNIVDRTRWATEEDKPCYFFYFNSFHLFRELLDGAIVSDERQGKFCLNPYSRRYKDLKESAFCKAFRNGVCDPKAEVAAGEAYIADWDTSRKDKTETLRLLREKYNNPNLIEFEYTHASGEIALPPDETRSADND